MVLATTVIDKKRDGEALAPDEIRFMIDGLVSGEVPDYQIAAWAMAVLCRGMNAEETAILTDCMLASGRSLERVTDRPRVDKHSTGGLGDKVSLILAPLLATFELDVPMLSGRGLGITGGTLDKLEAYPGFRCDLDRAAIDRQLQAIGCVITGTTSDVAPADRKLYALRDVTGTVPSIPLITASIMSKKLSESLDALVLDVKCGSGAFMTTQAAARELADSLTATGKRMGIPTTALMSDMDQPLGRMVGNACEANEAVEVLQGGGPTEVSQLTLRLGSELLVMTGRADTLDEATTALAQTLDRGVVLERYRELIEAQGGQFAERLPLADAFEFSAYHAGWIEAIDGRAIGRSVIELGGGRRQQEDNIDPRVGLEMLVRIGDQVEAGQPLVKLFASDAASRQTAERLLGTAFRLADSSTPPRPLIL